ncbi:MAG: glycerophosphodiester phosphodiesterase [Candidatus Saccharibacteria bacterium]|nr:glycerophosphodiester phosphodiesterase [Candidatus Saccharibacteria bacterium]
MRKKSLDFLFSSLIAHRGLHGGGVPENSMTAFGAAVRAGYIIELDVHLLADRRVAVFHDDNIKRMSGADIEIKTLSAAKLKKYRLCGTDERIPLLKDVLALTNGAVPIIIELKSDAPVGKLEKALAQLLDGYVGDYALKSFHPLIVRKLRHLFRDRPVGQLFSNSMFKDVKGIKNWVFRRAVNWSMFLSDFISVDKNDLDIPVVDTLRSLRKPILVWTIKGTDERLSAMRKANNCICEKIL